MRSFAILLCIAGASAQTVPAPESFDPIAVGTVRGYEEAGADDPFWRTDSPTTLTLDGHRWTVRRTQSFFRTTVLGEEGWGRREERVLVRFDPEAANVVVRDADGSERFLYPCRLDLAPTSGGTCGAGVRYTLDLDGRVDVGGGAVEAAVLEFADSDRTVRLASGIGEVGTGAVRLVQAIIAGDTLAPRPDDFPPTDPLGVDASRFVPLAAGNQWQYENGRVGPDGERLPEGVRRFDMGGTRTIEGKDYTTYGEGRYRAGEDGWIFLQEERYVRFDTLNGRAVGPDGYGPSGGPTGIIDDLFRSACAFDEPANDVGSPAFSAVGPVFCRLGDDGTGVYVAGGGPATFMTQAGANVSTPFLRDEVEVSLADTRFLVSFAADVGYLPRIAPGTPEYRGLRYARLVQSDGAVREVGQTYPVTSEATVDPSPVALRVGPNPTAGPLTVHLGGATEAAVVEVFDGLGRRVARVEAADGRLVLDAGAWAPGLYIVRATVGGETRTATVVRR